MWSFLTAVATEPPSGCPMHSPNSKSAPSGGGCPMKKKAPPCGSDAPVDPTNMMPHMSQEPAADQELDLSKDRVESTIPQGANGKGNWVYPSPQMFYNALRRKGKADEGVEKSMESVVAIHNNMNELTWKKVLEWEAMHCDECKEPAKLLRFMGRPEELSNKARAKFYLGLAPRPFDRHDWTVSRCGKEVRYIIDYYDVPENRAKDRLPQLHEIDAVPSIQVDVRPALDSPTALVDRVRMFVGGGASPSTADAADGDVAAEGAAASATDEAEAIGREVMGVSMAEVVRRQCSERMSQLRACTGERECARAHISLTMCIAEQVCRDEAQALHTLKGQSVDEDRASALFGDVEKCVANWGREASSSAAGSEAAV